MVTNGKHPGGRPSILTQELINRICEKVRAGNYFTTSASACGITVRSINLWMVKGEKDDEAGLDTPHRELFLSITEADATAEIEDIRDIRNGCDNWQSKAWIRERRSRERWGRVDKHEVTGEGGKEIILKVVYDSPATNNTPTSTASTPAAV